jgi:hypothetical protein
MTRLFPNSEDCALYQAASRQEAMVDSEAYNARKLRAKIAE